jgi:Spy/CpxP family protein refolding chaperone
MRRIALVVAATALIGCSSETTSPADSAAATDLITQFTNSAFNDAFTAAGGYDADLFELRLLHALPDSIRLSADQEAKIKALVDAYNAATKGDRDALTAVLRQARDAVRAHKSRDDVMTILNTGAPIAARLATDAANLKTAIDAVLTAEQRTWLASHAPKNCNRGSFPPLTDAQKIQMKAYEAAFEAANKADLQAVMKAMEDVKAAIRAGQTGAQVRVILDAVKPAIDRLATARKTLFDQLESVLTPEQKASGCIPLG